MAKMKTDNQHYTNIANIIREKTGGEDTYKPGEMPDGINAVYEKGKEDEHDAFWDNYQKNGALTSYAYAFYSSRWNEINYNPQYKIFPSNSNSIFMQTAVKDTLVPIDITSVKGDNSVNMFQYTSKLETIHKLIVNETNTYTNCFFFCTGLKNITFEGTIGRSIDFADCPLTVESMKNIIEHLMDYSGTENEFKYSVTFSGACLTMLEALDPETDPSPNGNSWVKYLDDIGWTNL